GLTLFRTALVPTSIAALWRCLHKNAFQVWIDDFVLKIEPDTLVLAAVVTAADDRPAVVDTATPCLGCKMVTIAIRPLADHVRMTQIPFDAAFFNVLNGKRKAQSAAGGATEMHTVFAINTHLVVIAVFVLLVFGQCHAHAFFDKQLD